MTHLRLHETPKLGVHQTGSSSDDVFEKCLNEASQDRLPKSSFKVEGWLHRSLFIIPVLIGLGGIVLIGYFAWIGKLICTLCPQ